MKEAMRRNWRRFLLPAVVLLLCLVWSGTALAESTVELHYGGILDYTKANQVAELVNQQRTANGKSKTDPDRGSAADGYDPGHGDCPVLFPYQAERQ